MVKDPVYEPGISPVSAGTVIPVKPRNRVEVDPAVPGNTAGLVSFATVTTVPTVVETVDKATKGLVRIIGVLPEAEEVIVIVLALTVAIKVLVLSPVIGMTPLTNPVLAVVLGCAKALINTSPTLN